MKRTYRSLLPYLLLALAVVALVSLWDGLDSAPTVSYNRMVQLLEEERPFFSLKLHYRNDALLSAELDGKALKLP